MSRLVWLHLVVDKGDPYEPSFNVYNTFVLEHATLADLIVRTKQSIRDNAAAALKEDAGDDPDDATLAEIEDAVRRLSIYVADIKVFDNELPEPPASPSPYEQALTDTQAMMAQIAALKERLADKSCEERDRIEIAIAALDRALANLAPRHRW